MLVALILVLLRLVVRSNILEAQRPPHVVASVDEGVGVEIDRRRALAGLAAEHAVQDRSSAAGTDQRLHRSISPHLTDAALESEVSDRMTDRGAPDVHRGSGSFR
jgi:hypothetical protein